MEWFRYLPAVNATLNATTTLLLLCGFWFIRHRRVEVHRRFMLSACATSVLFLISYLTYHAVAGTTRFKGAGWSRPVYFSILTSHTILAAVIVPLVIITLYRGLRRRDAKHRAIARWTLPIWLYVSVTGVLVYLFLYQFFPSA